ncbi:hypothetical protein MMC14_007327, partial [Varicellaria rhodocarpa]|nr:hypothetical protein [Varicellaria rhodocarpa]
TIIGEAIGVAEELEEVADSSILGDSKAKRPMKKPETAKDWNQRISHYASTSMALDTASNAQPDGGPSGSASFSVPQQNAEEQITNLNYIGNITEQNVKAAA